MGPYKGKLRYMPPPSHLSPLPRPPSGLSNHLKGTKAESQEILIEKKKHMKTLGFCRHNADILVPHGSLTR